MKKAYLFLIISLFLVLLSGCGNNKSALVPADNKPVALTAEKSTQSTANSVIENNSPVATNVPISPISPVLTLAEVSKHNSAADCWMIINNQVFNLSDYIKLGIHPGGDTILKGCGQEASAMFAAVDKHQGKASNELQNYLLGNLQ